MPTEEKTDSRFLEGTLTTLSFATETLVPSAPPIYTPFPTPMILPSVLWNAVFTDVFASPNPNDWNFTGPGWGYAPQPDGRSRLLVFNSSAPIFYQGVIVADVAVEAGVDVSAGTAHLYARSSGTFAYEARLTPIGEILLLRAGVVIAAATLPNFVATVPHTVRLNVAGDMLWVEVDGVPTLVTIDPAPLPPGQVGLSASFAPLSDLVTAMPPQNQVAFAAFTVYQPADQVIPTVVASVTPFPAPTLDDMATSEVVPEMTAELTPDLLLQGVPDLATPLAFAASSACMVTVSAAANAEPPGFDTGIDLVIGQKVVFGATGIWDFGTINGGYVTSAQGTGFRHPGTVSATANLSMLIGTVGNGYFSIGTSRTLFMTDSGRLRLLLNDVPGGYTDNSGALTVTIDLCSPTPTPTPTGTFPPVGVCDVNIAIPARAEPPGFDTGIDIVSGQAISFSAEGQWDFGTENGGFIVGPNGYGATNPSAVQPAANLAALIGNFGGGYFNIGSGVTEIANASGRLRLLMNDVPGSFSDNAGAVSVYIRRCVPTPTATATATPTMTPTLPICPPEGQSAMNRADAALPSPNCQIDIDTPTPTPTATGSPLPSLTPSATSFNVVLATDGNQAWVPSELLAVDNGLRQVGNALLRYSSNATQVEDAFNRVFTTNTGTAPGLVLVVRVNTSTDLSYVSAAPDVRISFTSQGISYVDIPYEDINQGYCKAFPEGLFSGQVRPRAVICNGSLLDNYTGAAGGEVSSYTLIHELGHVFDFLTGTPVGNDINGGLSIEFGLDTFYRLEDCSMSRVMGDQSGSSDWTRGERGWGSGPAASQRDGAGAPIAPLITQFQQNPTFAQNIKTNEEILEASADMFLNWVYRVSTDLLFPPVNTCVSIPTPTPEHWIGDGFLNRSWANGTASVGTTLPGSSDATLSGDTRLFKIHTIIQGFFNSHLSW